MTTSLLKSSIVTVLGLSMLNEPLDYYSDKLLFAWDTPGHQTIYSRIQDLSRNGTYLELTDPWLSQPFYNSFLCVDTGILSLIRIPYTDPLDPELAYTYDDAPQKQIKVDCSKLGDKFSIELVDGNGQISNTYSAKYSVTALPTKKSKVLNIQNLLPNFWTQGFQEHDH